MSTKYDYIITLPVNFNVELNMEHRVSKAMYELLSKEPKMFEALIYSTIHNLFKQENDKAVFAKIVPVFEE